MKTLLVLAAALLAAGPAVPRTAQTRGQAAHTSRSRQHRWLKHRRHQQRRPDGTRREGALRVGPDGTTVPEGLHPRIQPPPEIVKPPTRGR